MFLNFSSSGIFIDVSLSHVHLLAQEWNHINYFKKLLAFNMLENAYLSAYLLPYFDLCLALMAVMYLTSLSD